MSRQAIVVLDHKFSVIIVTFMTMWALFMDDMQVGGAPPGAHAPTRTRRRTREPWAAGRVP